METNPLRRIRLTFLKSPIQKWGAIAASILSSLTYVALVLLLYPCVDLLAWKGEIPSYAQMSAARKHEAADEWNARSESDRTEALEKLTARKSSATSESEEREQRWRATVYLALRDRVGLIAADSYAASLQGDSPPRLGMLSLVVRERNRWVGRVLGWLASWNTWTWHAGPGDEADTVYLTGLFILALGIATARGLALNATAYLAATATLDAVTRLRRAVYLHTYRLGSLAVRTFGAAEAVTLFTKQVDVVGEALHAWLTTTFKHPLQFGLLVIVILLVHFWLAVAFLIVALLVWLIGGQIAAYFRREARLGTRQAATQLALLQESMGLLRMVKCFQMERFNQTRVERQLTESTRANWRRLRGNSLSNPMLLSAGILACVALLYLAGRTVIGGELSVAGLALLGAAIASLVPPVVGWVESRMRLKLGQESADAILEFLERQGDAIEAADAEFLPGLTTKMEFRHVTLKESGTGKPLLNDISFVVPAGSRVAVVGQSLAEKRALMYLIPRFLDPNAGEIRIQDKNIRWVTHESLRAQVALVMQDDLVFSDTVANNIGCGDPAYTLPQIIEAAKLAHAHQFTEKLPYGYETTIGDHGYSLRPGERFRMALARALLRDPSILIIEEPTGIIDEDTLALLDDTLERAGKGRTILFLAQRLSTLQSASMVFVLTNGKLEAAGSHRELRRTNEFYRRLPVVADASPDRLATSDRE